MIISAGMNELGDVTRLAAMLWPALDPLELQEEMRAFLADENALIALLIEEAVPVGFAQCQLRFEFVEGADSSPVGYLEGIFMAAAYRGRGLAKQLLKYCENWAREKGCAEFGSDCEIDNIQSYHFHIKAGFTEANRTICFIKRL